MEHPEIDRVELLRGLDADERARCLFEWGLVGDPDPQIEELSRFAETGAGEWSWRLGPDRKPPQRTRDQYNRDLRFKRLGGKEAVRPRPEAEELPGTSHIDNPPTGKVRNPFASVGSRGDWATEGVRAHLERVKAQAGKPYKPYANDPIVTKAQAAANTGNPFTDVRATRSSRLRLDETARLYDAMAFARHALHRRMNAHLTVRWGAMGVSEAGAPKLLHELLNRAGKWFRQQKPSCVWTHTALLPDELLWVYVHEKSATYGFHTHVLLSMDVSQSKAFETWVDGCLARLVRQQKVPGDTAFLRRSTAKAEHYQDSTHWFLFKYIIKQLDPDERVASPFCDKVVPARDVFEPRHLRADLPVAVQRLVGACRRLDRGAQEKAQYVSRLKQGLQLYNDGPFRIPCLDEVDDRGCPVFHIGHGHEREYPSLNLTIYVPNHNREVMESSDYRYRAFEAAWERLTEAEKGWQAAAGGKHEAVADRVLAQAQWAFAVAEGVINLDRWGLMPDVDYYDGSERPKRRIRRSSAEWEERLTQANLKADAAYEWFQQNLQRDDVIDIVPREEMPQPKVSGRTTRRPTGRSRV